MTKLASKLPILMILAAAVAGAVFLRDHLGFEALAANRDRLLTFRDAHYALSILVFVAAYAAIVALSLPGATVATLTGGFLFGLFPGVVLNVTGASLGACLIFLAARAGFAAGIAARLDRSDGAVARLVRGLRDNPWSALLVMRLVPAVPFFVANLVPALAGIRLLPFAATTFLGIIPGALVFTSVGSGLGQVFAAGGRPDLGVILEPQVLLPMLGLAALSALPMILKRFRKES